MYAMAALLEREGYVIEARRGGLRDLALAIASHELKAAPSDRSAPSSVGPQDGIFPSTSVDILCSSSCSNSGESGGWNQRETVLPNAEMNSKPSKTVSVDETV